MTRTPRRPVVTTALAAASALALGTGLLPAAAPAPASEPRPTTVRPERLERGPDAAVPHVEGRRIVDGSASTRVRGQQLRLLGTRPDGRYVVLVQRDGREQVRAVTPGGGARKIRPVYERETATLSGDGTTLVTALHRYRRDQTLLRAYDSTTGERLGQRTSRGYRHVLDADPATVLHAGLEGPVVAWDLATDTGRRVSRRLGYTADLAHDRLAVFTKDPYQGGCTVVSPISDPATTLWRSCDEVVLGFSQDASHLATTYILADGLGPGDVRVRTTGGELTGRYRVRAGWFPSVLFEDDDTVLLDTVTPDASAVVRCDGGACELASDLGPGERF